MKASSVVKISTVAAALVLAACGFTPGQGVGGDGGAGTTGNQGRGGFYLAGSTGTGTGGVGMTGTAGGMMCGETSRPTTKLPPNILIVLDASGSMNQDANNATCGTGMTTGCGANSKWALLTPALSHVGIQPEIGLADYWRLVTFWKAVREAMDRGN